jgi:hypothetical protein
VRALFVVLGALLAFGAAPAFAAATRAEVVVELKGAPVAGRVPLSQLRDAHGHVDLQRMARRSPACGRPLRACSCGGTCARRSTAST